MTQDGEGPRYISRSSGAVFSSTDTESISENQSGLPNLAKQTVPRSPFQGCCRQEHAGGSCFHRGVPPLPSPQVSAALDKPRAKPRACSAQSVKPLVSQDWFKRSSTPDNPPDPSSVICLFLIIHLNTFSQGSSSYKYTT